LTLAVFFKSVLQDQVQDQDKKTSLKTVKRQDTISTVDLNGDGLLKWIVSKCRNETVGVKSAIGTSE